MGTLYGIEGNEEKHPSHMVPGHSASSDPLLCVQLGAVSESWGQYNVWGQLGAVGERCRNV